MAFPSMGEHSLRSLIELIKSAFITKADKTDPRFTDARTPTAHAASHGTDGDDAITPDMIGAVATADIVDNLTSEDSDKPLSAAQGKALNDAIANLADGDMKASDYDADGDGVVDDAAALGGVDAAEYVTKTTLNGMKNVANGFATLDENGKIDSSLLPGFVDDVVEGYVSEDLTKFFLDEEKTDEVDLERGKLYVDLATNFTYRWGGTVLVKTPDSGLVETTPEQVKAIWDEIMGTTSEEDVEEPSGE